MRWVDEKVKLTHNAVCENFCCCLEVLWTQSFLIYPDAKAY